MDIGQRVKVSGSSVTGVVIATNVIRDRKFNSKSAILTVTVKHDSDGNQMEYVVNELRKIQ